MKNNYEFMNLNFAFSLFSGHFDIFSFGGPTSDDGTHYCNTLLSTRILRCFLLWLLTMRMEYSGLQLITKLHSILLKKCTSPLSIYIESPLASSSSVVRLKAECCFSFRPLPVCKRVAKQISANSYQRRFQRFLFTHTVSQPFPQPTC